jgi:hypothetical protein
MKTNCESCGMPVEAGPYCNYCTDDHGKLQPFDERFERMVQWQLGREGGERADAEKKTRAYMATMPAWKNHPKLKGS